MPSVGVSPEKQAEFATKGKIGLFEAMMRNGEDAIPFIPIGGIKAWGVKSALDRIRAGEYEGNVAQEREDVDEVNRYLMDKEEERIRGFTFAGQVGANMIAVPSLLTEFALTAGTATAAKRATSAGLVKLLGDAAEKGLVKRLATKATGKVSEALVGGAARVASPKGLLGKLLGAGEEALLEGELKVTEDGIAFFKAGEANPHKNFLKGMAAFYVDIFTEDLALGLGAIPSKAIGALGKKLPKGTPFLETMKKAYKLIHPDGDLAIFSTKVGFTGVVDEYTEEQIAAMINETLGFTPSSAENPASTYDRLTSSLMGADEAHKMGV